MQIKAEENEAMAFRENMKKSRGGFLKERCYFNAVTSHWVVCFAKVRALKDNFSFYFHMIIYYIKPLVVSLFRYPLQWNSIFSMDYQSLQC